MHTAQHKAVCFGEILWDILPSGEKPGGAPMNVAYHLQKLGMEPALISKTGTDDYGRRLVELLNQQGVCTTYIQTDAVHPTGVVNATIQTNNEVSYDIVQPVAWDFIEMEPQLNALVQEASFFIFGSLAARQSNSRETLFNLLENATTKVLDINLRPPHFNRPLLEELLSKANILKLNEHELSLLAGWHRSLNNEAEQLLLVQDRYKINTIVVTRGGEGAMLIEDGAISTHKGYAVTVADTVGSGDAILAGFLFKKASGATPAETLAFANGLGAFIATQSGACPPYSLQTVHDLIAAAAPFSSTS